MKVAFVLPNLKAGGGNRSQIMLANGLAERGHDVAILVPRGQVSETPVNVDVKIIETGLPLNRFYLIALINYPLMGLKLFRFDVAVVTFSITLWFCWFPWVFLNKRIIYYARGYDPMLLESSQVRSSVMLNLYKWLARKSYVLPVELVVNSQWTGKMIQENIKKTVVYKVINNGIDHNVFKPLSKNSVNPKHSVRVLTIGKNQRFKGFTDTIQALETVYKSFSDFKLIVMTPDELEIPNTTPLAIEVTKPRNDKEIVEQLREADIFISASWHEGFCNPPLEAMACGTPVVLTDSGGVREYAQHKENCLMSPPKEPEKLAENILTILNNKILTEKLIHNGLKTANQFQWNKSIDKFERLVIQQVRRTQKDNENSFN